jgi:hypothetical protein
LNGNNIATTTKHGEARLLYPIQHILKDGLGSVEYFLQKMKKLIRSLEIKVHGPMVWSEEGNVLMRKDLSLDLEIRRSGNTSSSFRSRWKHTIDTNTGRYSG